jgi:hypothetical protein
LEMPSILTGADLTVATVLRAIRCSPPSEQ